MKRLNVMIKDDLHKEMKALAILKDETIIQFVTEAIRQRVEKEKEHISKI